VRALVALTDTEAASLLHSLRGIGLDVEADCPPLLLLRGERALLAAAASLSASLPTMGDGSSSGNGGATPTGGGPLPLHQLPHEFLAAPTALALKRQQRGIVMAPIFPSGPEMTDEGPPPTARSPSPPPALPLEEGQGQPPPPPQQQQQRGQGRAGGGAGKGGRGRRRGGVEGEDGAEEH
jgi:hypothetical protein